MHLRKSDFTRAVRLSGAALLITVALAAFPVANADAAKRGVTIRAGAADWFGFNEPNGSAWAHVTVVETSLGSTQLNPAATRACVEVFRQTTQKRNATSVSDRGCGVLELRGMGTGSVTVKGSVASDSGDGTLTVDARSVRDTGPALALPIGWCGGGWIYIPCPDTTRPTGIYRRTEHEGTVTSTRAGSFGLAALGGPTIIWELY